MSVETAKPMREITKNEYIKYMWIEVTEYQHVERVYIKGLDRNPSEMMKAKEEYELYESLNA